MARNATARSATSTDATTTTTNDSVLVETTERTVRLPWSGDTVEVSSIPSQGIAYLLQYGVNKTSQDAASGLLAKAKETYGAVKANKASEPQAKSFRGWLRDLGLSETGALSLPEDDFARQVANHASAARWTEVMAGRMDIPGTINRLTGMARVLRDVVDEILSARAKARKMTLSADQKRNLIEQFLAKPEGDAELVKAQAEAARRWEITEAAMAEVQGESAQADVMSLLNG